MFLDDCQIIKILVDNICVNQPKLIKYLVKFLLPGIKLLLSYLKNLKIATNKKGPEGPKGNAFSVLSI